MHARAPHTHKHGKTKQTDRQTDKQTNKITKLTKSQPTKQHAPTKHRRLTALAALPHMPQVGRQSRARPAAGPVPGLCPGRVHENVKYASSNASTRTLHVGCCKRSAILAFQMVGQDRNHWLSSATRPPIVIRPQAPILAPSKFEMSMAWRPRQQWPVLLAAADCRRPAGVGAPQELG